jgi:predicted phosphohydrolase
MKLQFVSDLHIEFRGLNFKNLFKYTGDVLAMCGDICAIGNAEDFSYFIEFLKYITPKYKYVLHVAGNHEYYAAHIKYPKDENTIQYVNKTLKGLNKQFPNYIYLNCDLVKLQINKKDYYFLGCTLWTYIKKNDYKEIGDTMNDYRAIYTTSTSGIRQFMVEDSQKLHNKHLKFIRAVLDKYSSNKEPFILLTHHKPINDTVNPDVISQAYASNSYEYFKAPIRAAFFGHTHVSYSKIMNKIHYYSNPLGYPGQRTLFQKDWIVNV